MPKHKRIHFDSREAIERMILGGLDGFTSYSGILFLSKSLGGRGCGYCVDPILKKNYKPFKELWDPQEISQMDS